MYAYLKGIVAQRESTHLVLDVSGVGYKIYVLPNFYPAQDTPLLLHTSFIVRENMQALYGFEKANERETFELLISLSGIGPKTALCLLGKLSVDKLRQAVHEEDSSLISSVPKIGKKTAQRLLLELKDKLFGVQTSLGSSSLSPLQQKVSDATKALTHLGFAESQSKKMVEQALKSASEEPELSELISKSLQLSS